MVADADLVVESAEGPVVEGDPFHGCSVVLSDAAVAAADLADPSDPSAQSRCLGANSVGPTKAGGRRLLFDGL